MAAFLHQVSIVVLARDHNPTILHPSFLTVQQIVPSTWELSEPPVCTSAVSVVKYASGIQIFVDPHRLQVLDRGAPEELCQGRVCQIAEKYIRCLPHVRYTAVGINFEALEEHPSPRQYLADRFLREGPWSQPPLQLEAVAIDLRYPREGAVLRLRCDCGDLRPTADSVSGPALLFYANYHVDLEPAGLTAALQAVNQFEKFLDDYRQVLAKVAGVELR